LLGVIKMDEQFLEYLKGERKAHILQARKQEQDYSISDELEVLDREEKSKPGRIKFLEKRFSRYNYAAQLLGCKIRRGILDEEDTEKLKEREERARNRFEKSCDLYEEYVGLSWDGSPDYSRFVQQESENILKLREEIRLNKFLGRLKEREKLGGQS